ncbi:MAG TPA: DUF2167 domain-containing protein [Steroidobacteraceae bacterium]|nr:DUF2167 domain-containing protein [Steroidobacteraceae bacterium]
MQRIIPSLAALIWSLMTLTAFAQESAPPAEHPSKAAWEAAGAAMQRGPSTVTLRDQGSLQLPDGYAFIPVKEATRVMESMGNQVDGRFIGLIVPLADAPWFVTVDYEESGYIKDDDAKNWDAKELLDNLKEGTEAGNERRTSMGIPPLEVTRWIESPTYDGTSQRLVWSIEARNKGVDDPDPTINYNTYLLGREGYFSLDLVTTAATVTTDKLAARELLAATTFNDGKRYTDFNASTDKVAAYGLAALVGGLAAKKLGLIAVLGAFLLKFAKVIFLVVAGGAAAFAKFFKRDKSSEA